MKTEKNLKKEIDISKAEKINAVKNAKQAVSDDAKIMLKAAQMAKKAQYEAQAKNFSDLTNEEIEKRLELISMKLKLSGAMEALQRARSISVGSAGGGTTEVSIRKVDGETTFIYLQPVETMELIHQMAASIGCHIAIKPRDDFGSWRQWKTNAPQISAVNWQQEQFPPMEPSDRHNKDLRLALASPPTTGPVPGIQHSEQLNEEQKYVNRKNKKQKITNEGKINE